MVALIRRLREETDLQLCASLGLVDEAQARELAEAGLRRLHGNLRRGRGFSPGSAHPPVRGQAPHPGGGPVGGAGGVLRGAFGDGGGVGGSGGPGPGGAGRPGAVSVPLKVLVPIPATPWEPPLPGAGRVPAGRLGLPVRPAQGADPLRRGAGRVGSEQEAALLGPVDGVLAGDYLTTPGPGWEQDRQLFAPAGTGGGVMGRAFWVLGTGTDVGKTFVRAFWWRGCVAGAGRGGTTCPWPAGGCAPRGAWRPPTPSGGGSLGDGGRPRLPGGVRLRDPRYPPTWRRGWRDAPWNGGAWTRNWPGGGQSGIPGGGWGRGGLAVATWTTGGT
jgi:hypothetical protein